MSVGNHCEWLGAADRAWQGNGNAAQRNVGSTDAVLLLNGAPGADTILFRGNGLTTKFPMILTEFRPGTRSSLPEARDDAAGGERARVPISMLGRMGNSSTTHRETSDRPGRRTVF